MYKTKENKSGISLIVLVITIIVVIIISAAVILTLTTNNPIAEARKATFLSDIDAFKSELDMYNTTQYATTMGNYDLTSADFSVTADENMLYTVIPSLKGKTKYRSHFEVIDGGLAYTGVDEEKIDLAKNVAGIMTTNAKPEIALTTSNILPVKAGASVTYTVTMTGTMPITIANLTGNIKVLNNGGTELGTQPSLSIGTVSGTTADKTRSAVVTINTTGMAEGTYKIKVLAEAVQTSGSKNAEKISTATFEIDNTAPAMPTITINPTTWTNGNVTATIIKSNEADTLEYSTNGTTWNAYTTALTITSNSTVYARETDIASNVSNVATQVISIIDKTAPTVAFGTNGASGVQSGSTTVSVSDSESGVSTRQYVWDTQNATAPTSGWITFTNGATLTKPGPGTFYLWIKATDVSGNVSNTKSNTFTLTAPIYNFAYTGTIQNWSVPYTGNYKIETWGAQGGGSLNNPSSYPGAQGAYAVSYVALTQGDAIKILVGGKGNDGGSGGAGGGGTFVATSTNTPLAVAGGGGGNYQNTYVNNGRYGQSTQTPIKSPSVAPAPVAGQGGYTNPVTSGWSITAAGGGFYSNGASGTSSYTGSYGGTGFVNGGTGGTSTPQGGFGGGGGAAGTTGAGGGGYTGGSGGDGNSGNNYCGYGGGSYYTGSGSSAIAGNLSMPNPSGGNMTGNSGNGYARITIVN